MSETKPGFVAQVKSFPATFWVANTMEIFERMAWYGFFTVAALYMTGPVETGALGFSTEDKGLVFAIVPFFLYIMPVLTGALADRYGYKKMFTIAYVLMVMAYFLLGQFKSFWPFLGAFMFVAVAAAIFKPVVVGTVARVTDEHNSSTGFGIFYMMVNIGGFAGPIVAGVVRGFSWSYVFIACSIWAGVNLIIVLTLYKEPTSEAGSEGARKLRKVLDHAVEVLGNLRFFITVFVILIALLVAGFDKPWFTWEYCLYFCLGWLALNFIYDRILPRGSGTPIFLGGEKHNPLARRMFCSNWRFALFLLIMSGFWTSFNQIFLTMPEYIRDFVDTRPMVGVGRSVLGENIGVLAAVEENELFEKFDDLVRRARGVESIVPSDPLAKLRADLPPAQLAALGGMIPTWGTIASYDGVAFRASLDRLEKEAAGRLEGEEKKTFEGNMDALRGAIPAPFQAELERLVGAWKGLIEYDRAALESQLESLAKQARDRLAADQMGKLDKAIASARKDLPVWETIIARNLPPQERSRLIGQMSSVNLAGVPEPLLPGDLVEGARRILQYKVRVQPIELAALVAAIPDRIEKFSKDALDRALEVLDEKLASKGKERFEEAEAEGLRTALRDLIVKNGSLVPRAAVAECCRRFSKSGRKIEPSELALGVREVAYRPTIWQRMDEGRQVNPEHIVNFDAGAIVLLQVLISFLMARFHRFTTMIVGMIIAAVGIALSGLAGGTMLGPVGGLLLIVIAGIVIFAIGEMMASPTSQEYVGRIAPRDKVALYMGYYFVAVALGNLFGGLLSGQFYGWLARDLQRPDLMWLCFGALMLATAIIFVLYNRFALPKDAADSLTPEQ